MKKRKRKIQTKEKSNLRKYLFSVIFLLLVICSYFEISGNFYITGYLKDVLFYPSRSYESDDFIEGVNLELKEENTELKKILSISDSLSSFDPIYAAVVERNNSYWFNYVTINKGSADGIEKGMAVVDSLGLVGIIEKVSFNSSVVSLITSDKKSNNISVKIAGNEVINKILSVSEGRLVIEGINKDYSVQLGSLVFTNGLGDKFPSGILIGSVSDSSNDVYNTGKIIYVDPVADFNNLRFVAVLKRG